MNLSDWTLPAGVAIPLLGVGILISLTTSSAWAAVGAGFSGGTALFFFLCGLADPANSGVCLAIAVNAVIATAVMLGQPRRGLVLRDAVLPLVWLASSEVVMLADDARLVLVAWLVPPLAVASSLRQTSEREARSKRLVWLYHLAGGLPLVVAAGLFATAGVGAGVEHPWVVSSWKAGWLSPLQSSAVFLLVSVAVMVRLGVPPLHSWLPTMSETLPAGTMLALTSVQMAVHVMVDWALVPLPAAVPAESALVTGVGLVGVVYASIVALSHSRLRRLVAFVTIAQSCALLVGLATGSQVGVSGAMTNALSVATTGRGLLLAVAAIESRTGLVDTRQLSGLAHTAPRLATVAILLALAMAGLPGSLGFVGEDLLLQSLLERHPVVAAILVACTALTSIALLRAVLKTCFGPAPAWVHGLPDLFPRERALVGLAVLLFLWGLFPAPWVSAHQSDIQRLMAQHQDTSAPALIRTTSTPGLPPEPTGPTPLRAFHETRHPPHAGILRRHSGRDFPE